jgi:hypothetical protein
MNSELPLDIEGFIEELNLTNSHSLPANPPDLALVLKAHNSPFGESEISFSRLSWK